MPRGDSTGPVGYGPMTGRAAGYCAGYGVPGYANPGLGRGVRYGRGRGMGYGRGPGLGYSRGYGWGFVSPYPAYGFLPRNVAADSEALNREADYLRNQVDAISDRLAEIDEAIKKLRKSGDTEPEGGADSK